MIFKAIEKLRTLKLYITNPKFFLMDLLCRLQYVINNPYLLCENYNKLYPSEKTQCYGETPFSTLSKIMSEVNAQQKDTVYEVGCGRGRASLWLRYFIRCTTIGIDINPFFITRATRVKKWFSLDQLTFKQTFAHWLDFDDASIIYLYGTCLHEDYIRELVDVFKKSPSGLKLITVSFSILDFGGKEDFIEEKVFKARFDWGLANVYIQRKTS